MLKGLAIILLALTPISAAAADFSVTNTKLGMTDAEIISALPDDLRPTAERRLLGALGESPIPYVRVSAGTAECEALRFKEHGRVCTRYSAFLMSKGSTFHSISITLDQFFETSIDISVIENLLIKNFGEPSAKIMNPIYNFNIEKSSISRVGAPSKWPDGMQVEIPPFSPLPLFIWTPEISNIDPSKRNSLLSVAPNVGQIGLTQPLLRVFVNLDGNRVSGLKIILSDPVAHNEWSARLEQAERAKRLERERAAEGQIRLR
ncbi:hypothetical protein [Polymorphum gilvum]|uniref:hypothetical protein n=1 Tax=Polymorphum gilvum TaxID=991904 RepID=UPI0011D24448|nr:hypothetical protein [Polymorphum gilvum]